jgi:FixJ family two-component response regulator
MRGKDIVVVEDDRGMREALERLLRAAGYGTEMYSSAEAYLDGGGCPGADCFILDVHLPGLSGFELREKLQEGAAQPPVIFITGFDEPDSRERAHRLGAAAYLPKPFPGRDLVDAVNEAVATA